MSGPLSGTVVVDLSRALAGPHAAMMLGDLGARVIKVEAPGTGDDSRGWGPPFVGPDGDRISTYFLSCNRNKESVVLDLKSDAGRETLDRLVKHADVLVENFRPGVMDRLGFSMDSLMSRNSRLVALSITGFGHDGPEGGRAGYDQIAQGEAGLMSITGQDPQSPQRSGVPIGDLLAGIHGAYGVVAALLVRERTGKGAVVRTSLLAGIVGVHAFQGTSWTVARQVPTALGNHHAAIAPYGMFACADGFVQIAVGNQNMWTRFCAAFDLDARDGRFATNTVRVQNRNLLIAAIEEAFADVGKVELLSRLDAAGVPAGELRTMDRVYDWEQTRSQGLLIDVAHPVLGSVALPGPPLRFDDAEPIQHRPPPLLGEHQQQVEEWLDRLDRDSGDAS